MGQFTTQAWKNKKKPTLKKHSYIFSKKCHPKKISYTFLKKNLYWMDQPRVDIIKKFYTHIVFISWILEKKLPYSSSRRFLYRSWLYWRFSSFSSSERFLYCSQAYWHFLSVSSSERFWYLSRASSWSFSLFFLY